MAGASGGRSAEGKEYRALSHSPAEYLMKRTVPYAAKLMGAKKVASLGYGVSETSKVCANTVATEVTMYAVSG